MVEIEAESDILESKCPHGVSVIKYCEFCYSVMYNTKGIAFLDKDLKRKLRKNKELFENARK